ncbi:hypothetical protein ABK046_52195, partial [Streptomyces caeruleatus]
LQMLLRRDMRYVVAVVTPVSVPARPPPSRQRGVREVEVGVAEAVRLGPVGLPPTAACPRIIGPGSSAVARQIAHCAAL